MNKPTGLAILSTIIEGGYKYNFSALHKKLGEYQPGLPEGEPDGNSIAYSQGQHRMKTRTGRFLRKRLRGAIDLDDVELQELAGAINLELYKSGVREYAGCVGEWYGKMKVSSCMKKAQDRLEFYDVNPKSVKLIVAKTEKGDARCLLWNAWDIDKNESQWVVDRVYAYSECAQKLIKEYIDKKGYKSVWGMGVSEKYWVLIKNRSKLYPFMDTFSNVVELTDGGDLKLYNHRPVDRTHAIEGGKLVDYRPHDEEKRRREEQARQRHEEAQQEQQRQAQQAQMIERLPEPATATEVVMREGQRQVVMDEVIAHFPAAGPPAEAAFGIPEWIGIAQAAVEARPEPEVNVPTVTIDAPEPEPEEEHEEGTSPCASCEEWFDDDDLEDGPDGDSYCEDCLEREFTDCYCCGEKYDNDELETGPDDEKYCEDCLASEFYVCRACDERFSEEDMHYVEDNHYCEHCFHEHFEECYHCEEYISRDYSCYVESVDRVCCEHCYGEHYAPCQECDSTYETEDLIEVKIDGEDELICPDCIEELGLCDECHEVSRTAIEMVDGSHVCRDCRPKDLLGQQVFAWDIKYYTHEDKRLTRPSRNGWRYTAPVRRKKKRATIPGPLEIMWPRDAYGHIQYPADIEVAYIIWRGAFLTIKEYRQLLAASMIRQRR